MDPFTMEFSDSVTFGAALSKFYFLKENIALVTSIVMMLSNDLGFFLYMLQHINIVFFFEEIH